MMSWRRGLSCIAYASLFSLAPQVERADACGGPDIVEVGELLAPQRSLVFELLQDPGEGLDLDDFRFLRPFELAGRDPEGSLQRAFMHAGEEAGSGTPDVEIKPLTAALQRGDAKAAKRAAQAIVDRVLNMPTPLANRNAEPLRRAAEYLELAPQLSGIDAALSAQFFLRGAGAAKLPPLLRAAQAVRDTPRDQLPPLLAANPKHPRAGALGLVRLAERMRQELPSGWPGQIPADPAVWEELEREHDAWLKTYATHPLRDLGSLSKLRLLYLRGEGQRAWDVLLDLYARRPLRAAWEMRHLLLAELRPTHVSVVKLADPVLASALVRESNELTPADWVSMWKRSEKGPTPAWSANLQERLFVQALRLGAAGTSPRELPGAARAEPQRWAELHTAALLAANRDKEALEQAKLLKLKDDRVAAKLVAHAYMRQCNWVEAARAAQSLGPDSLRYVLEVLVDEAALETLAKERGKLGTSAKRALALRKLQTGTWQAAAELHQNADTPEARAWRDAASLAADTSGPGQLRFAKWLLGAPGAE